MYLQEVVLVEAEEAEAATLIMKTVTTPNIKINQLRNNKICLTLSLAVEEPEVCRVVGAAEAILPRDIKVDLTFPLIRTNSPSQKKRTKETAFSFERLGRMERKRKTWDGLNNKSVPMKRVHLISLNQCPLLGTLG